MMKSHTPTLSLEDFAEVVTRSSLIEGARADRLAEYFKAAPEFSEHRGTLEQIIADVGLEKADEEAYWLAALLHGALELLQEGGTFCPHPEEEDGWLLSTGVLFGHSTVRRLGRLVAARERRGAAEYDQVNEKLRRFLDTHGEEGGEP